MNALVEALRKAKSSKLEDAMLLQLRLEAQTNPLFPMWLREWRFHATRMWRVDFVWLGDKNLILEIEGGTWSNGRHTRGSGYEKDAEKYNEAAIAGFRVIHATSGMVKSGAAMDFVRRALR